MPQEPPDATTSDPTQTTPGRTGHADSPSGTSSGRTVLNPSEGGLAFLGENLITLFTIAVPTLFLWLIVARAVPHLRLLAYGVGLVWALTSATFLFARYDWMGNREFVASISRFYTQSPDMLFDRFPTTSGIEQPERSNPAAWLARKPPFKYFPVIGATNQTRRPQDLVPLKRPFENSPAIESEREYRRGGGVRSDMTTVIGAIRVEPPNIVTDDRSSWQQSAKWFAAALDSTFEGNSQLYEPMRSANYEPRVFRYRLREQQLRYRDRFDPVHSGDDPIDLALADYARERGDNVSLRDITALVRDYYVVHEVTPADVIEVESGTSGGIRSVPGIGHVYTEIKKWQLQQSDEYVEEMAGQLEYRLEKMANALQKITGLRCSVVPSEHFSQAVADHYQAANVYAHANFRDLIRQSPQPAGRRKEDRLMDLLDHVPESFENPDEMDEGLDSETRRILGIESVPDSVGPSPSARKTGLDPGAQGMAEYGVAWDSMSKHPMARTGVLRSSDVEGVPASGTTTTADGSGTPTAESDRDHEQSRVDQLVDENGGPVDFDVIHDYESDFFVEWYRSLLCAEDNVNRADPNYLVIDDQQFVATLMVTHWPSDIDPGFLEPILRFEDPAVAVAMSTHIHDLDQNRLEMELADQVDERASKVEKVASSRFPVFLERFKAQHTATQEMLSAVTTSDHDTFETNTYLEVRAHTPRSLYKAIDTIKNRLRSEGAAATLLKHNHEKGHQTVAPICDDQINHSVKMRSDGLGCLNPWTVRNLYDEGGIEVGENTAANEPLAFDFWNRTLAPHFGMWTESGGGKTTTITILLNRLLTLQPDDFFLAVIDPLEEFANLCELHGGERIVVGGSKGMNPLAGSPTPEEKVGALDVTPYNEWREGGIDFLALYYDALDIEFTSAKRTIWSKAIRIVGERHGIANDHRTLDPEYRAERQQACLDSNEASETGEKGDINETGEVAEERDAELSIEERAAAYVNGESDGVSNEGATPADVADPDVDPRSWPTLLDAAEIVAEMSDDAAREVFVRNPDNERQVEDREIVSTDIINNDIEQLTPGGKYDHFGKENEIEISEDAAFVYADMQLNEGDRSAGLEMHVLLDQFYDHAKKINLKSMIFCDEFHYMLRDDTVMESLNHKFRHGRHWDLAMGVASQSYRDLFGEDKDGTKHLTDNAEVMFENMSAQFYLKNHMGYKWGKKLGLSKEETTFINDAQIGEMLLRIDTVGTYPVEVVMDIRENPRETVITEYDPNKHGEDFLAYLEQHRDACEWSFAPVDVTDAPPATIEARVEMDEDDADAFDPYAGGATAPTGTSAGGGGGGGGGGDD